MKRFNQYILIPVICILTFSCDNAFLTEESFFGESSLIVVSPNWEATDYEIYCQGVGNAGFTIVQAPEWLNVSASTGRFVNNIAILNCKANTYVDFSKTGIYYSYITLSVEGKGNLAVPVGYITEGNPVIEVKNHLTIDYGGYIGLPIENTGNGILLCYIAQYPAWLTLRQDVENPVCIIPSNGQEFLHLYYNWDVPFQEDFSDKIIIVTNDKNKPVVEVTVQMDLGYPTINAYGSVIMDFGRTETTRFFSFYNQGSGHLVWKIEGCPEWLTVSASNGITQGSYAVSLIFTCNRERMPSGQNTATIYLKTNDKNTPLYPITVTAYNYAGNPDNVKEIPGNITDAHMDKNNDMLYLTTSQPNRLLVYNTRTKAIVRELPLNHAPTCFSMSEDGRKAVIGHNGYITSVNLDNFSVSKIIDVNYNIFDIEWGTDNWVCYTPGLDVQHYQLEWINLDSALTYISPSGIYGLYGKALIKKIPRQNYIVASRLFISPSGITVFDIRTRDGITYFHEEINDFWFSSDGYHLFSSYNRIYRTSSLLNSSTSILVSPIGTFSPAPSRIHWIDHCPASRSVWILSSSPNSYNDEQREITQYDDSDFTRKKSYYYSDYYNNRFVQAHYIFANQTGTELIAIRNVTGGGNMWSLEFIPVGAQ